MSSSSLCLIKKLITCFEIVTGPRLGVSTSVCMKSTDRWLHYGFSPQEARRKALGNDMVNADLVLSKSLEADLCLSQN